MKGNHETNFQLQQPDVRGDLIMKPEQLEKGKELSNRIEGLKDTIQKIKDSIEGGYRIFFKLNNGQTICFFKDDQAKMFLQFALTLKKELLEKAQNEFDQL
jgi:hypothetical protein